MKVCVEQTIGELDGEMKRLSDLKFGLLAAFSGQRETVRTVPAAVEEPRPMEEQPKTTASAPVGRQADTVMLQMASLIRKGFIREAGKEDDEMTYKIVR